MWKKYETKNVKLGHQDIVTFSPWNRSVEKYGRVLYRLCKTNTDYGRRIRTTDDEYRLRTTTNTDYGHDYSLRATNTDYSRQIQTMDDEYRLPTTSTAYGRRIQPTDDTCRHLDSQTFEHPDIQTFGHPDNYRLRNTTNEIMDSGIRFM